MSPAVTLKEYCQVVQVEALRGVSFPVWERLLGYGQCVCVCGSKIFLICFSFHFVVAKEESFLGMVQKHYCYFLKIIFQTQGALWDGRQSCAPNPRAEELTACSLQFLDALHRSPS